MIREDALRSSTLAALSPEAERLFWRLLLVTDDHGRFVAEPVSIHGRCLALVRDVTTELVARWLDELVTIKTVCVYSVRGCRYGHFPNWKKYQRIRAEASKYPIHEGPCGQMSANVREPLSNVAVVVVGDGVGVGVGDEGGVVMLQPASPPAPPKGTAGKTSDTWSAYSSAYEQRYDSPPVRNAKVNGMLARFLDRVSIEEAPEIAAFYVWHHGAIYVSSGHCVDLLLRDAEKLRTEWKTGRKVNASQAKRNEATAANPFLAIVAEEKGRA